MLFALIYNGSIVFKNSVLIFNTINIDRYDSHNQKLFGFFKNVWEHKELWRPICLRTSGLVEVVLSTPIVVFLKISLEADDKRCATKSVTL